MKSHSHTAMPAMIPLVNRTSSDAESDPTISFTSISPAEQKAASRLFSADSAAAIKQTNLVSELPHSAGEVAMIGRSNVGKSTLINAILGSKNLARTSKTPGCTREMNVYAFGTGFTLMDLPGYGFAKARKEVVDEWNIMIGNYIRHRSGEGVLKRIFLLVDSRHGLTRNDKAFLLFLEESQIPFQIILTKIDRLLDRQLEHVLLSIREYVQQEELELLYPVLHLVSAKVQNYGLADIRHTIAKVVDPLALKQ